MLSVSMNMYQQKHQQPTLVSTLGYKTIIALLFMFVLGCAYLSSFAITLQSYMYDPLSHQIFTAIPMNSTTIEDMFNHTYTNHQHYPLDLINITAT